MNLSFVVSIFIKKMCTIDNLFEAVLPNILTFPFHCHKTAPPFLSQSRKLEDPFSILIKTILFISFSQI